MADPLLVFLVLLNAYVLLLFLLHRKGLLGPGKRFELVFGILLMWRTEQGKKFIDRASRPRRFWYAFGDAGVAVAMAIGFLVFLLLILNIFILSTREDIRAAAPGPEMYLVLPGINPIIPVGYGIFALAVALVVHEGAHGILARAHDIKVKSLGLLFAIVPIGAFVEPDDEEMEKESTRAKNRVFAAGIMMNLVVALLAVLLAALMWSAVTTGPDGVLISNAEDGLPAAQAGITEGMIVTHLQGDRIRTLGEFNEALNQTTEGDTVTVTLWHRGSTVQAPVQLIDKYEHFEQANPQFNNESFRGKGFMGVGVTGMAYPRFIRDINAGPLSHGLGGLALFLSLPLARVSPVPGTFQDVLVVQGPLAALPEPLFWMFADALYWVFWLNFMVGSFNALPMPIVDGGQMFRSSVRALLRRRLGVTRDQLVVERPLENQPVLVRGRDETVQAKMDRVDLATRRITRTVGLVILGMVLFPLLMPLLF